MKSTEEREARLKSIAQDLHKLQSGKLFPTVFFDDVDWLLTELKAAWKLEKRHRETFENIREHTIQKGHCVMIEELCDEALKKADALK